jgi:SAM-dependent methyltransferase
MNKPFNQILTNVAKYYSDKVIIHGTIAKGVDWNSTESQVLRFEQLIKVCDTSSAFSINDYGCGYGALIEHMRERDFTFQYRGFDISEEMIARAQEVHRGMEQCEFFSAPERLTLADYTVASGIFSVKQQVSNAEWTEYVLHTIKQMAEISQRGFSFNLLTKYSDPERMRPDLYYADPLFLFDYCKRNFSRFVALLHDYPLYEFTLLVQK